MLRDETHFFPSAAAQAVFVLDEAHGRLDEAISLCALNAAANPGEFDHWLEVLRALDGGAEA